MVVFVYMLMWLRLLVSTLELALAPVVAVGAIYYLARRLGSDRTRAALFGTVPVFLLLAWPLSGLMDLKGQCSRPVQATFSSGKQLIPIDSLLIEGHGMWHLGEKLDVEKSKFGPDGQKGTFLLRPVRPDKRGIRPWISTEESELRSRYKVTTQAPHAGNFAQRYLTTASIIIEDRESGEILATVIEPAWGGGIAGKYIAGFSSLDIFNYRRQFLSCGYAGQEIGFFRDGSKARFDLYEYSDMKVIERVFTLPKGNN